jgi:hypothetical protein
MGQLREKATAQLSSQKDRASEGLGTVASAVRQSTQHLRDRQHDTVAQYVEQAADQIDRFSTQLRSKDLNEIANDVKRFAKRQPAVFIGAAFVVGLIGARFLKSSSEDGSRRRAFEDSGAALPAPYRGGTYGAR